jgi:hypothetical protein
VFIKFPVQTEITKITKQKQKNVKSTVFGVKILCSLENRYQHFGKE